MHAMATPLLTKADGSKFGKTETGTIWLDPAMTSPTRSISTSSTPRTTRSSNT